MICIPYYYQKKEDSDMGMPLLHALMNALTGKHFQWARLVKHQSKATKIHTVTVADIQKDLLPNPDVFVYMWRNIISSLNSNLL